MLDEGKIFYYNNFMNRVFEILKKYMIFIAILTGISIVLGMSYSNFIVASENHKVAEMYIGTLKYSMSIDGTNTNTLSVPSGETIVDVTITNENPIDTYYKLIYQNNSNVSIKYYQAYDLDNSNNISKTYDKSNDKITLNNTNAIKLMITNNSTSSQKVTFKIVGGFATNTLNDVTVPTGYTIIGKDTSTNTYFCTITDTLTQGLKYVNGQYTYAYKQEGNSASSGLAWYNIGYNGWGVQLTDKTSTNAVTSKLCAYINNKPITSMSYMFSDSQATTLDVSNFNTSNLTSMNAMFDGSKATTLDVSNFDTSKVTNMSGMFYNSKATTLDVSNFDTSKVTNMSHMFYNSKATTIDVSNFDTSNVTDMYGMFYRSQATTLDLSNFNTSKVTDMSFMFYGSTNLKTIYVSNKFNTDKVTSSTNMFSGCTKLIGGAGTKYNSSYVGKTYARIDGGTSNPGYFTKVQIFSEDSWDTIVANIRAGKGGEYKVGSTRTISMGTYGTHTLRIANTSTPSECSTSGFSQSACGFVLEFADIITSKAMNGTNKGGWPATSLRTFVNSYIYNALPSELRNVIIDTTVVSGHGNKDTANFTSIDKLYLLAPKELNTNWANGYDTTKDSTRQLDYYKNIGTNNGGAIKKNSVTASNWWLRTADSHSNSIFYYVQKTGFLGSEYTSSSSIGVSPAFRIG